MTDKLAKWVHNKLHIHWFWWIYRNPAVRTCSFCNRHEEMWCNGWDLWKPGKGWWEVCYEGDSR